MNENRRHKRFFVEGMEINGKMMFATEVSVLNISISGMSVKADRRLDIGKEYTVKLQDHHRAISVKGVVVWSTLVGCKGIHGDDMAPVYEAGMKFKDVLSGRIEDMIGFIGENVGGPEHRFGGLRFSIKDPGRAVLQFPSSYFVKKISAGGMLIEGKEALEVEQRLPMELSMPGGPPIGFTGRVASCAGAGERGIEHFDIGIEFAEMGDQARKQLLHFIGTLNAKDKAL